MFETCFNFPDGNSQQVGVIILSDFDFSVGDCCLEQLIILAALDLVSSAHTIQKLMLIVSIFCVSGLPRADDFSVREILFLVLVPASQRRLFCCKRACVYDAQARTGKHAHTALQLSL